MGCNFRWPTNVASKSESYHPKKWFFTFALFWYLWVIGTRKNICQQRESELMTLHDFWARMWIFVHTYFGFSLPFRNLHVILCVDFIRLQTTNTKLSKMNLTILENIGSCWVEQWTLFHIRECNQYSGNVGCGMANLHRLIQ